MRSSIRGNVKYLSTLYDVICNYFCLLSFSTVSLVDISQTFRNTKTNSIQFNSINLLTISYEQDNIEKYCHNACSVQKSNLKDCLEILMRTIQNILKKCFLGHVIG